ncbi:MAG: PqqD family protein [Calditrichia bacterium]
MLRKKKKDRGAIIAEWLEYYPVRNREFEINQDQVAVIIIPHPENRLMDKLLPRPQQPAGRIKLDEIGTFVWEMCDGKSTIKEICTALEKKFGERVKPAEERTVVFLQQMYKEKFIQVYLPKENPPATPQSSA